MLDDAARLAALAGKLGLDVPVREIARPAEAGAVFETALPVLPVRLRGPGAGRPSRSGQCAGHPGGHRARAPELALAGEIAGMVTNPIQKKTLQDAGFRHPGHTEYLAELAGGVDVAMMLACPELRVVPVTIHLSLAEAVRTLDTRQDRARRPHRRGRAQGAVRHRPAAARRGRRSTRMPASRARWATRRAASSRRRSKR